MKSYENSPLNTCCSSNDYMFMLCFFPTVGQGGRGWCWDWGSRTRSNGWLLGCSARPDGDKIIRSGVVHPLQCIAYRSQSQHNYASMYMLFNSIEIVLNFNINNEIKIKLNIGISWMEDRKNENKINKKKLCLNDFQNEWMNKIIIIILLLLLLLLLLLVLYKSLTPFTQKIGFKMTPIIGTRKIRNSE